jgi:predicted CopG family antitoxin
MKRKTISLDLDVFRALKRRQSPTESLSGTLRRVLADEQDPADYLDELFRDFGGKGVMTTEGIARVRARRKSPVSSNRPANWRRRVHAA